MVQLAEVRVKMAASDDEDHCIEVQVIRPLLNA